MAANFPNSPVDGQTYSVNGINYRYSSSLGVWLINADAVTDTLLVANTITVNTAAYIGTLNVAPTLQAAYTKANSAITYVRKTGNYTANVSDGIIADTSAGSFTITLPATPATGAEVVIVDGNDWAANSVTVARNGSTIEDVAENLILDVAGTSVTFIYDGSTWETYFQLGISNLGLQNTIYTQANLAFAQANAAYIQANVAIDTALAFAIALG